MGLESYTWDFFIAHAGADKSAAEDLFDLLSHESRVFLDSKRLLLGDEWDFELPAAQQSSFITVVLVSSNTEGAYYQREEIAAAIALARKKKQQHRVVPIYLDSGAETGSAIPYGLRLKHGLTISPKFSPADCARELILLLHSLNVITTGTTSQPNPPAHDNRGLLHQPPLGWVSPVRRNRLRYKVAAFDLDGTLLRGEDFDFSWEAVWRSLGFGKKIQNDLIREYRQRTIAESSRENRVQSYQNWCDKACAQFKRRGLTRNQLRELCQPITLTHNCREALSQLRSEGVVIAIISGGINTFLEDKFPDYRDYVDFVFINELLFSSGGLLEGVHATAFDFQGKAEALDIVIERVGCTSAETVFIGDRFNDLDIMVKVDKAIAYPLKDKGVEEVAHESIQVDNLMNIVPHILVE